jgi:Domain of unknown function (DUF6438)/Gram-negative bacterial TonB protein C-terminal
MRRFLFCTLLLSSVCALAQAPGDAVLKSYDPLVYPPIARAARVSGQVTVEFQLNGKGETVSVAATDGPAMLRGGAENFVKSWKFDVGNTTPAPGKKYLTTIQYKAVEGIVDPRNGPNLTVHSDSFHHFDVSIIVGHVRLSNCPTGADEDVPSGRADDDFVEVSRSGCYGACPSYSIRVQADGSVAWNGGGFVEVVGKRKSSIGANTARNLLEEFRTKDFWSYCGGYTRSITDSSGTEITVKLGGKARTISDYAGSGPKALQELLMDVDRTADSHRWRHGDPGKEPITHIDSDAYRPKPGVTPLMLAAARNDLGKLKGLLAAGSDLKQTDASGWSALMYASTVSSDFPVQVLLKAGADPNQSSPHGDTPLMVNALSGYWNDDLVKAGAIVNARNKDGQTSLMVLVLRHKVDQISAALQAGADASLKDAKGRTALDYLRLASCGKSPIFDPLTLGWNELANSKCTALDSDDLHAAERLLEEAMRGKK